MNVEIGMAVKRNARYIFSSKAFPTADYRTTIAVDVCPRVHATIANVGLAYARVGLRDLHAQSNNIFKLIVILSIQSWKCSVGK